MNTHTFVAIILCALAAPASAAAHELGAPFWAMVLAGLSCIAAGVGLELFATRRA